MNRTCMKGMAWDACGVLTWHHRRDGCMPLCLLGEEYMIAILVSLKGYLARRHSNLCTVALEGLKPRRERPRAWPQH